MPDFETIYRERAAEYDRLVAREDYQEHILRALSNIRRLDDVDVVELGAGTGRLTRLLAPHVRSVAAFDQSMAMLRVAAGAFPASLRSNWQLAAGDNRRVPVKDGLADVCIAGWSLGHATGWYPQTWPVEIDLALREMRRVLRRDGTIIILETLGTGRETPQPPNDALAAYYRLLEEKHGCVSRWIRTDYRFESVAEAESLTRFFFGAELADRVARESLVIVPECTGLWALTV